VYFLSLCLAKDALDSHNTAHRNDVALSYLAESVLYGVAKKLGELVVAHRLNMTCHNLVEQ
jgi:hypothetical protein